MYLVQYSMPFLPLLAGHHSNQNHYPHSYAAPPGPAAVAPPLLVPSQAPVSAPAVTSHFTSTLPPSYQQQYAYEEEDYDRSEQQLHSGGYIENSLNHSVVPYMPSHQSGLVKHYLDHVLQRQYLLADSSIAAFIIRTVQQSQAVRDAVCLLASLHQESLRRGINSSSSSSSSSAAAAAAAAAQSSNALALALHEESSSSDSSKAYKRICESLYSSTQGSYTEGEAMAGLFVVSAFLFRGGRGAWQHFLAVATEWVWNVLSTGADPAETILRCSDSQQFVIKTTFWFDILASTTRLEPPRFLMFYRQLWSSSERGAHIESTGGGGGGGGGNNPTTTNHPGAGGGPGATTASGHRLPSPLSMISVMGCENKTALAIAETSNLAYWKAAHERQGRLSVPDLVDRGRKIEKDCLLRVPPPPTPASASSSSMQPGGVYYPAGGGIPDELSEKRRLTADIFRSTARVYLHSVISGEHPGCPEIRDGVRETIECLQRVPAGGVGGSGSGGRTSVARSVLRSVVFGICLCGCLADDPKDREFLIRRLNAEEQAEGVGNCTSACLVMREVWRRRAPNGGNGNGNGNGNNDGGCCGESSTMPSPPSLSWREATQQFGGESLLLV
jgi:hypothetical protein